MPYYPLEAHLFFGQSNITGSDKGPHFPYGVDRPHPKMFNLSRGIKKPGYYEPAPKGEIMPYRNPAQDDNKFIGMSNSMCKTRLERYPGIHSLVVLSYGQNGGRISPGPNGKAAWRAPRGSFKGDFVYNRMVNEVNAFFEAHPCYRLKSMNWIQGGSDASVMTQQEYADEFANTVSHARANILTNSEDVPLLVGSLAKDFVGDNPDRLGIDAAHRSVADYIPNAHFVNLDPATTHDGRHYDSHSLRGFVGPAFEEALAEL